MVELTAMPCQLLDKLAMNTKQQLIQNGKQHITVKQHFDSIEDTSFPSA
jgi:hypothetical protein